MTYSKFLCYIHLNASANVGKQEELIHFLSRLQTIRKKSVRREKHAKCEKLARKKGTHEITQKLTTHISRFNYFLVQLNFIHRHMRKSLCLVHNHRFYHETRDMRNLSHEAAQTIQNNPYTCVAFHMFFTSRRLLANCL